MSEKILVIFAHPLFEKSRINKSLVKQVRHHHVTFHDLYELYPDFNINIQHEQRILLRHEIIIWMHPVYWYSCPPLLKQWIDMVLEVGWAYGPGGHALEGKMLMQVITTGGPAHSYSASGYHLHTLREFFLPFEQTTKLCRMQYLPPFVTHGTHRITSDDLKTQLHLVDALFALLQKEQLDFEALQKFSYANDYLKLTTHE